MLVGMTSSVVLMDSNDDATLLPADNDLFSRIYAIKKLIPIDDTNNMMTYFITPKTSEIKLALVCKEFGWSNYGAEYSGLTEITHAILASDFQINWDNLTIEGAIDIGKTCLKATATAAKYGTVQGVSESCDVYILSRFYGIGWLIDNKVTPDSNAPNDARYKYILSQADKEMKKRKRIKRNAEKKTKEQTESPL